MHLLPAYYNNNSNKKKKAFRKPGWIKAQAEHDKWLKSRGVHPDQLKNKNKDSGIKAPNYKQAEDELKLAVDLVLKALKKDGGIGSFERA